MGISLSEYILRQKIEGAKNLLCYSRLSIVEIGESFCFSSQSHFTRIFKKETGVTPHKYREMAFHSKWDAPDAAPSPLSGEKPGRPDNAEGPPPGGEIPRPEKGA